MGSEQKLPDTKSVKTEERLEALVERVEQLEKETGHSTTTPDGSRVSIRQFLELGLTRRQAIAALGFVAAGATTAGAVVQSVGAVQADTSETVIGSEDHRLETIYAETLDITELIHGSGEEHLEVESVNTEKLESNMACIEELESFEAELQRLSSLERQVVPKYDNTKEMLDQTDEEGSVGFVNGRIAWRKEDT